MIIGKEDAEGKRLISFDQNTTGLEHWLVSLQSSTLLLHWHHSVKIHRLNG